MKFDGKLEIKSKDLKRRHGIGTGGPVQMVIDNAVMRYMGPYMPRRQAGELEHMMHLSTVVGSGRINIPGPYAHYLHEGIVYVDPKYNCAGFMTKGGEWRSRKNVIKVRSNPIRELQYTDAPMRGKKFFDRMKADYKQDILDEAQDFIEHGGGRI